MKNFRSDPDSLRNTQISPTAVLLTGAAVVAAMIIGLTGPRLRDRHGSLQQEVPIGEIGFGAEQQEAQMVWDLRPEEERTGVVDAARVAQISKEALGRSIAAPNLDAAGFTLEDARIVQLVPSLRALALVYQRKQEDAEASPRFLALFALPDHGNVVRIDGFGNAMPFAPGDEWINPGTDLRSGPPRTLYATSDKDTFWMMVSPDPPTVLRTAPLLPGTSQP